MSPKQDSTGNSFRTDIEGLRAVAIAAVLLCHAGLPFAAGGYVGVDVFFVISGFLITRLLLSELEYTGTVSLLRFYARRAKRLLPLLFVVLVTVVLLSRLLLSPVQGAEVSDDVVSSAFYVANWHFAAQSVDYFAQGLEPSPVQHLWSLAIEEQFYIVWPTLMLLAVGPLVLRGYSPRPVLWVVVAIVIGASLAIGVQLTGEQPAAAYFSTLGRAWELALGASLALLGAIRLPGRLAAALGWVGLAAIVYAVLAFDSGTPFPGLAALVPTLGTACLILAGSATYAAAASPSRALSLAPVRYVGRISYSWYLWHWPALVFAVALWGPLSVPAALAVLAASWVPTALSHRWVEKPLQHSTSLLGSPRRALALGLGCTAIAAAGGLLLAASQPSFRTAPSSEVAGAAALASQPVPQQRADAVRPNPLRARADRSRMYYDGCLVGIGGTNSNRCLYGDPDGERTLILFGDSHALQYAPAFEELAETRHWRLIVLTKAECTPGEAQIRSMVADREYSQCDEWREESLRRIEMGAGSTVVVMSGDTVYTPYGSDGEELGGEAGATEMEAGYVATLTRIHRAGLRTVVIKDTPVSADDVPSCVSEKLQQLDSCAFRRVPDETREFDVRAAEAAPDTDLIDVTAQICPRDLCRAVIGNALVYRDKSHLTATYARTLAPSIERGLRKAGLA